MDYHTPNMTNDIEIYRFFLMSKELALLGISQRRGEKEKRRVTAQCQQGITLNLGFDFCHLLKHVSQYLMVDQKLLKS